MTEFTYKSKKEQEAMSMSEFGLYKRAQRKYEFEQGIPLKGIKRRRAVHPIIDLILRINRTANHQKITILKNKSAKPRSLRSIFRPTVYVFTHIGGNDVETMVEATKRHAYLFFGDPEPMYKDKAVNTLVYVNGSIDFDTKIQEDRKISFFRGKELLSKRGRLIVFAEGAWNVFEHLLVMKLYPGAAKMAIEVDKETKLKVDIVPGAIEQYDDEFVIKFGDRIKTSSDMNYDVLTEQIRDVLATLKYEIFESQPPLIVTPTTKPMIWENVSVNEEETLKRKYDEQYRQGIIDRRDGYSTLQDIYNDMYKDPNETSAYEIIAETQTNLEIIHTMKYTLQEIDELLRRLNRIVEKTLSSDHSSQESDSFDIEISNILELLETKIVMIEKIIAYLDDNKDKKLEDDGQSEKDLDFDFDSPTVKRREDLQSRIKVLEETKQTLLSLSSSEAKPASVEAAKRISLS